MIALLGYCLALIDFEHKLEFDRRNLSLSGARLTFGNSHAGVLLIQAWKQQDQETYEKFLLEYKRLQQLSENLKALPQDTDTASRTYHLKCLEMQDGVLKYFEQMKAITDEGFSVGGLQKIMKVQRRLYKHLDGTFFDIGRMMHRVDETLKAGQAKLQVLERTEVIVIVSGFVLAIILAFVLLLYFHKNFSIRIAAIADNIERIARREKPEAATKGSDEIAELDQAFHDMWQQLAQASEREKALFSNSSDIICVLDEKFQFVQVSNACVRMWGYEPERLEGKALCDFVESEELKQILNLNKLADSNSLELMFKKSNAGLSENLWTLTWSGEQMRWYAVVHDIAELKLAEAQRKRYLEQIAEDFQVPIQKVSELIDKLLSSDQLPEKALVKFRDSKKSIARMIQLIEELQQVEHLNPEEIRLVRKGCNIRMVLQEAIADVESFAQTHKVRIEANTGDINCEIDKDKMVRVLVNLLSNAIKFSPENASVFVSSKVDRDVLTVSIRDEGRGISESALKSLFEPFRQAKAADGARGKGTGLGLFICQKIVQAHCGEIEVLSKENEGSTFSIKLPLDASIARYADGRHSFEANDSMGDRSMCQLEAGAPGLLHATNNVPYGSETAAGMGESFWGRRDLGQKATILIGAPVLVATAFVIIMVMALFQGKEALVLQMQRRELSSSALTLNSGLYDFSVRIRHIGLPQQKEKTEAILDDMPARVAHFRNAASTNVVSSEILNPINKSLDAIKNDLLEIKSTVLDKPETPGDEELRAASNRMFAISDSFSKQVEKLIDDCDAKERHLAIQPSSRMYQTCVLDAALILNLWLATLLAAFFSKDIAKRLKEMAENASRLASGAPLSPPVSGSDEIAHLDQAFHKTAAELRIVRERERSFLTNAQSSICALDQQARFVTINPATSKLLLRKPDEILNSSFYDFVADKQASVKEMLALAQNGCEPVQFETETGINTLRWSIIWSEREKNFFCTARDISAQKELERLKQRLIAILTHDLRTPLASLLGFTGLTQEGVYGNLPDSADQTLSQICQEIDRILELVNDLLDLEKIQTGNMVLNNEIYPINELILEAIKKLDQHLSTDLDSEVLDNSTAFADKDRFSQVLASLILEVQLLKPAKILISAEAGEDLDQISVCGKGLAGNAEEAQLLAQRLNSELESNSKSGSRLRIPLLLRIVEAESGRLSAYLDTDRLTIEIKLKKNSWFQNQS